MYQFLFALLLLPDAVTVQRQVVSARARILTGDVTYEFAFGSRPDQATEIIWHPPLSRDHIVFDARDGWRAFQERWTPTESPAIRNGKSVVRRAPGGGARERFIMRPDVCYNYYPDLLSDGSKCGISEKFPQDATWEKLIVVDPRKFGMLPKILMDFPRLELAEYVQPENAENLTLTSDTLDGRAVLRVEYLREGNRTIQYWVDPERGMNVVQISEAGSHENGSSFIVTSTSTLQYHKDADLWFPSQVIRIGSMKAKKPLPTTYERILVTEAQFNIPVDREQFEISALQAHPHTSISSAGPHPDNSPSLEWTGEKVAPIGYRPDRKAIQKRNETSTRQLLLVAGAVFLLLAAITYLIRRARAS